MKVRFVLEYNLDQDIFEGCKREEHDSYNKAFTSIVNDLELSDTLHDYDTILMNTNIIDYKLYDDSCKLLFEM